MSFMQKQVERLSLHDAVSRWYGALQTIGLLQPLATQMVPVHEALNRVTAHPLVAENPVPHYRGAAMDGYGVRSVDTQDATGAYPVQLQLGNQAIAVDTGHPLPDEVDAVIKLEDARQVEESGCVAIEISAPIGAGKHVRKIGEDIQKGQVIVPAQHVLRPQDLGALAACGLMHFPVYRRPKVAIIPTGKELRRAGSKLGPGEIPEFNSYMLEGQAKLAGCEARTWPMMIRDDYTELRSTVKRALYDNDLLIINAGSSLGSTDYTAQVIAEVGEISVQGIAIRPGHPTILGMAADRKTAIVGLPGYPVAAALVFDRLITPLLHLWQGQPAPVRSTIQAYLTAPVQSAINEDTFVRVTLSQQDGTYSATPLIRGAGILMSLVNAQGLLIIPNGCDGYDTGEPVEIELF